MEFALDGDDDVEHCDHQDSMIVVGNNAVIVADFFREDLVGRLLEECRPFFLDE